jgi:peptidoglycan/LPS O-acetylase OafA/YrhL
MSAPWISFAGSLPLGQVIKGHDNNYNLIRFLAAFAVLVSHSYALTTGDAQSEPFKATTGVSLGSIAVDIFFATSGFLVAGSLIARGSLRDFLLARALRIFPALWVALILTTILAGVFLSTSPLVDYWLSPVTWKYLIKNGIMVLRAEYALLGVFESVPWRGVVNGSLWSLPHELRMYIALALTWLLCHVAGKGNGIYFRFLSVALAVVGGVYVVVTALGLKERPDFLLAAMFFEGVALRAFAHKIKLNLFVFLGALACVAILAFVDKSAFLIAYRLSLPYLVLCAAYLPGGRLREFANLGDCSYGLYIYAFPIQQVLVQFFPSMQAGGLVVWATLLTLPIAIASWVVIESRALKLKDHWVRRGQH